MSDTATSQSADPRLNDFERRMRTVEDRLGIPRPQPKTPTATAPTQEEIDGGFRWITDGAGNRTKQFGNAPVGGNGNTAPGSTAPLGEEWTPGATFRINGLDAGEPLTVTRTGDGVVFAQHEGREQAFHRDQINLVERAKTAAA